MCVHKGAHAVPHTALGDDGNFFCCLGNTAQTAFQLLVGLLDYWIVLAEAILAGQAFSTIVCNGDLDFTTHLIPDLEAFNKFLSCIPFSFFQLWNGGVCPGDNTVLITDTFANLGQAILNITTVIWRFEQMIINVIKISYNCGGAFPDPGTEIACLILLSLYDMTIGYGVNIWYHVGLLFACSISGGVGQAFFTLAQDVWNIFGWDGTLSQGNIRVTLCLIIQGLADVVSFISCFFVSPSGASTILTCLANASGLTALITALDNTLSCVVSYLAVLANCIGGVIYQFTIKLNYCFTHFFPSGCLNGISGCSPATCTWNPPVAPLGPVPQAARAFPRASARTVSHVLLTQHYGLPYVDYSGDEEGLPEYFIMQEFRLEHNLTAPCQDLQDWLVSQAPKFLTEREQGQLSADPTTAATFYLMSYAYKYCMASSGAAAIVSGLLGEPGPELLLSPYTFIDPFLLWGTIHNLTALPGLLYEAFFLTNNVTGQAPYANWLEYAGGKGLDPLTTRVGFYVSAGIWAVLKMSDSPVFDPVSGNGNLIYHLAEILRAFVGGTLHDLSPPEMQRHMAPRGVTVAAQLGKTMRSLSNLLADGHNNIYLAFNSTVRQIRLRMPPEIPQAAAGLWWQMGNATLAFKAKLIARLQDASDPGVLRRRAQFATLSNYLGLNYKDAVLDRPEIRAQETNASPTGLVEKALVDKGYRTVRQHGSFRRYQEESIRQHKELLGERVYAQMEREHEQRWLAAEADLPGAQLYREAHALRQGLVAQQTRASAQPVSLASPLFAPPITPPPSDPVNFNLFTFCYSPTACLNCTVVEAYIQDLSNQLNFCLNTVIPKA